MEIGKLNPLPGRQQQQQGMETEDSMMEFNCGGLGDGVELFRVLDFRQARPSFSYGPDLAQTLPRRRSLLLIV